MLTPLVVVLLLVDGAVLCWLGAATRRERTVPAASAFALSMVVTGLLAFWLAGSIAADLSPFAVLGGATLIGYCFPPAWLFFSLRYTGQRGSFSSPLAVVVVAPFAVGVLFSAGALAVQYVPGLSIPAETGVGLATLAAYLFGIVQSLVLVYAASLTLVACGVLLWSFYRHEFLEARVGLFLTVFAIAPSLSVLLGYWVAAAGPLALSTVVSAGVSIGTVAALGAAGPYDLFEQAAAAGTVGPRTLFEELEEAVIVTDTEGTVVKLNAAAERHHPAEAGEAVGQPIDALLGDSLETLEQGETVTLYTERGRAVFEPNVSTLTDARGASLGHAVVLRDVTKRRTREQRLSVLNRVLRHNLRNDLNVILGHAEQVLRADAAHEATESAETILDTGQELLHSSEEIRDGEQLLDETEFMGEAVPLARLAEAAVTEVASETTVEWVVEIPADIVVEGAPLVEHVIDNLLENAVQHNDNQTPWVRLHADYDPHRFQPLRLVVEDDGPGIPDHEKQVIETDGESPLEHGSGVGLWTVRWAVTRLGGDVTFADREPRGTVATVWLSRATRTEPPVEP